MSRYKGRPPKFEDPEKLCRAIEDYFNECDSTGEPYTVSGLALTIGIGTTQLRDYKNCVDDINILKQLSYEEKRQLSDIVKRAYQICENYVESKMVDPKCNKSPIGYIFALKNYGHWVDKTEVEKTNKDITVTLID